MRAPWTRVQVKSQLVTAAELVEATTRRPGPRAYGQALPDPVRSQLDAWFQQQGPDYDRHADARNRARIGASAAEIAEADETLGWLGLYVRDDRRRRALALYLAASIRGVRWSAAAAAAGLAGRSASRWRDEALDAIADALNRDLRRNDFSKQKKRNSIALDTKINNVGAK